MKKETISADSARKIVLDAQLLDGGENLPKGKTGIAQTINTLGYVQIDTISIVKRSHHHTLWTRKSDYHERMLHQLQAEDRAVFEYWGHAMSYIPMTDFRYFLPRMRNFENPTSQWAKYQMKKCSGLLQPVLERIRNEGPLSSKDFSHPRDKKGGTWWDWKPAKVALEMLFWRGDLMVTERRKFQKVYDLTERVLPPGLDTTMPNENEIGRFLVRRALSAFGTAAEKDIQKYLQPNAARDSDLMLAGKDVIAKSLTNLIEAEEVIPLTIEGDKKLVYYALSDVVEKHDSNGDISGRVFMLSPFDNLIIQRERVKRLFGFDYTLECYVPAAKRKYGYFVLPILWGGGFVGRIDPKADRKKRTLSINNLMFEPQFKSFDEFLPLLAGKLIDLATFNECEKIVLEKVSPGKLKKPLESLIKGKTGS